MTAEISVVLLRPKEDGNVGAVARSMRNFGVSRLLLVAPRAPLGAEARRRAMGGIEVLRKAQVVASLEEALVDEDLVVGTSDVSSSNQNRSYLRRAMTPPEWGSLLAGVEGRVALVLGPEDNGLSREELNQCDVLLSIPADRGFPTLNLSHAAAVLLYEAYKVRSASYPREGVPSPAVKLNGREKEIFFDKLAQFLTEINYPAHKRRGLLLLYRRVLGRAVPSEHEYSMLLGFLKRAQYPRRERWKSTTQVGSECEA
ncbi:MAG: TrmJ/YjtD family RNA methyltransferase [Euryarchaeota archaeon]|nr:TrmJ/YjtD family RNA methyltransferase [Euryarchaeota archaeon]